MNKYGNYKRGKKILLRKSALGERERETLHIEKEIYTSIYIYIYTRSRRQRKSEKKGKGRARKNFCLRTAAVSKKEKKSRFSQRIAVN